MPSDPEENAVGHACGHLDGLWSSRRDPYRYPPSMPEAGGTNCSDLHFLASEESFRQYGGVLEFGHPGRAQSQPAHSRVADSVRQKGAAARDLVERCDGLADVAG